MAWRMRRRRLAPTVVDFGFRDPETNEVRDPNPKQRAALESEAEHIFYGGAVGGGKTVWLVTVAIQTCLTHPAVAVAIFRRHYKELAQNVVGQFLAMLPPKFGRYNSQLNCFTFPNGSVCWFGHCARDSDVYLYQGNQWVKLLIDEASHLSPFIIGYLSTRVRSPRRDVLLQVLMASNPGGPAHGYLKRGWVRPDGWAISHLPRPPQPMEVWRPRPPKDRPTLYMNSRQFIPAYFHENYVLQTADPMYLDRVIAALPGTAGSINSAKGKQLAEGDWDVNDGMMFGDEFKPTKLVTKHDRQLLGYGLPINSVIDWHVIRRRHGQAWRPKPQDEIYGSVDYGYGHPWAFYLHAVMAGNHVRTFFELYRTGLRDVEQAKRIREVIEFLMQPPERGGCGMQKPKWIVYDPQMDGSRAEVNVSQTISDVYHEHLADPLALLIRPGGHEQGARLSRIQRVKDALAPMSDGLPHWTITEDCEHLIRTLPDLATDVDDPEYIDDDAEDHAYESCGRFFQMRPAPPRVILPSEIDELDPLSRAEAEWKAGRELKGVPHLDIRKLTKN